MKKERVTQEIFDEMLERLYAAEYKYIDALGCRLNKNVKYSISKEKERLCLLFNKIDKLEESHV